MCTDFIKLINDVWDDRTLINSSGARDAIYNTIHLLDEGKVRVAVKTGEKWTVNEWVKKAIVLYFSIKDMELIETGPFEYYDKIPLKKGFKAMGVRVVPQAIARYGSYISRGTVLMPSYVNIGAFIDCDTLVDTWATVGSCAQIGRNVHLSGGVGIGGVLEPIMASPVIIEDNCFIGSRCILVEGVIIGKEAVLGANVVITNSTKIIDVTGPSPVEYKGTVPPRSVVIPGSFSKSFPAGDFNVNCALIIGKRKESTEMKISLNEVLREFNIPV